MPELDQVPLTDELLALMRKAAQKAIEGNEAFITPRSLLLALLDDPHVGPPLASVVNRDRVLGAEEAGTNALRLPDDVFATEEPAAMRRYDTIAFKTPDGRSSMWLNREAYRIFIEGAQRVEERYLPKHVALGMAAQAVHAPGMLTAIRVEPGVLADAIYKL